MNMFMKNKADFSAQAFHVVQRLIDEKSFFHLKANNIGEQTPVEQQAGVCRTDSDRRTSQNTMIEENTTNKHSRLTANPTIIPDIDDMITSCQVSMGPMARAK